MGNVMAAESPSVPSPPMVVPPMPPMSNPNLAGGGGMASPPEPPPQRPEDTGPGTFEDLHKKCKDVMPVPFEGAKVLFNKGLSNHFQVSHTWTMSTLQPSGYRFGCTYVGTKQYGPMEAFPIMIGDMDPSGNLNANIIHQFSKNLRCKFVSQIQNSKWLATQITSDYRGQDFTAALTVGNPDIVNGSAVMVCQYLQNVAKNLCLGCELLYQTGSQVPGGQIGIFTVAGRYTGDKWAASANLTPVAGGVHACYYQNLAEQNMQVGVEFEGSLRTQECQTTIGFQAEMPGTNSVFRGQLDSNWCIGAVLEKRIMTSGIPFTFALSAHANHVKSSYRFGLGFII
jgi:mitochondrial import receptor subunit TOM40